MDLLITVLGRYLNSEYISTWNKPQLCRIPSDGGGSSTDQWVIIVEIFRHAPNSMPDAAGALAGQVVAGPTAAGAVGVSGCGRGRTPS